MPASLHHLEYQQKAVQGLMYRTLIFGRERERDNEILFVRQNYKIIPLLADKKQLQWCLSVHVTVRCSFLKRPQFHYILLGWDVPKCVRKVLLPTFHTKI